MPKPTDKGKPPREASALARFVVGDDDGPDGLALAGWGLLAIVAFTAAYASWQFAPPTSREALFRSGSTEQTASVGRPGDPRSGTVPTGVAVDLKRETADLRRQLALMEEKNLELARRMAALEGVDPTATGSVPRQIERMPRVIEPRREPTPVTTIPAPAQPAPAAVPHGAATPAQTPPATTPASTASIPARPTPLPELDTAETAPEPTVVRSQFAADLGAYKSLAALRAGWSELATKSGDALRDLVPLAQFGEANGELQARLVVGPFANAADAVKLCARLKVVAPAVACAPTVHAGQALALR